MGILDLFRDLFPVPQRNERLGPNDIPADILNDLRQNHSDPELHSDNQPEEQHIHENSHPDNRSFHGSYGNDGFRGNGPNDQEFENAFREMDNMFKNFFGGAFGAFGFGGFGNPPLQPPPLEGGSNDPKTLREKMLDRNNDDDDDFTHFHYHDSDGNDDGNDGVSQEFSFRFHTPFFRDFFDSPFGRHGEPPFGRQGEFPFGGLGEPPFDQHGQSPIDRFGENNGKVEDQDLDNNPNKPSVDDLLSPRTPSDTNERSLFRFPDRSPSVSTSSSSFKYSTVTKKMNSDGSVETTSRKRDSEGNEEITVTRNIGEQTHTITTKKKKDGEEEKVEKFVNMDENDLQEFEGKWKDTEKSPATNPSDELEGQRRKDLGDLFSSWWKPRL